MPIKVLAIDDDSATTNVLVPILRSHGYQVSIASDGADGISRLQNDKPDVIILDFKLPATDGREICRRLRTISDAPVLVLSAIDAPSAVTAALDAGADDYLIKPVTTGVLIAHVNNLSRRASAQRASAMIGPKIGSLLARGGFSYPENSK